MTDKIGTVSAPSCPPLFVEAHQQEPPPPYSPYYQPPTEIDASKPYPSLDNEKGKMGFQYAGGQPSAQPGPAMQPQMAPQTVIVQPPIQVVEVRQIAVPLGPASIRTICPFCKADVTTNTEREPSVGAYIAAAVICFLGCVFGCCLIPLCMDSCKVTKHHCPHCKKFLGRYTP